MFTLMLMSYVIYTLFGWNGVIIYGLCLIVDTLIQNYKG